MHIIVPAFLTLACKIQGRRMQARFPNRLHAEGNKPLRLARILSTFVPSEVAPYPRVPSPRFFVSIERKRFCRSSIALSASPSESVARPPVALLGLAAAAAVVGISSSAVLVRGMSGDATPLAIAAWRTAAAAALQLASSRAGCRLSARQLFLMSAAGLLLALHFYLWFVSLGLTSVLRSTVLVSTVPLWSALMEWSGKGSSLTRKFWTGNLLALCGIAVIATQGGGSESAALALNAGDLCATLAAVAWAAYMQIGKAVRSQVAVGIWQGVVCGFAALALWPVAVLTKIQLWGFPTKTLALMLGMIVGPQLVGHQCLDYILKWLPTSTVSIITLLEPVGAGLLAALFFHEYPTPLAMLGAFFALMGVWLAL